MVTDVTAEGLDGLVLQRPAASVAGAGAQREEDRSASRSQTLRVGDGVHLWRPNKRPPGAEAHGDTGQVPSEQPQEARAEHRAAHSHSVAAGFLV